MDVAERRARENVARLVSEQWGEDASAHGHAQTRGSVQGRSRRRNACAEDARHLQSMATALHTRRPRDQAPAEADGSEAVRVTSATTWLKGCASVWDLSAAGSKSRESRRLDKRTRTFSLPRIIPLQKKLQTAWHDTPEHQSTSATGTHGAVAYFFHFFFLVYVFVFV